MQRFDIAVVGLGVLGAATCDALSRLGGISVVGFDRYTPPHQIGSSHGHTRMIREAYWENPLYVPIVQRAYELWTELGERTQQKLLHRTGGLMIGPETGPLIAGSRNSAKLHHIPVEHLNNQELIDRFGGLFQGLDGLVATVEPNAGFLWLEPSMAALLQQAQAGGVSMKFGTSVQGWQKSGSGYEIQTSTNETISVGRILLCCSGWLASLVPGLEGLTIERQVQHWLDISTLSPSALDLSAGSGKAARQGLGEGELPVFLFEDQPGENWYGFPDVGRGVKVGIHHRGELTLMSDLDRKTHGTDRAPLIQKLRTHLPSMSRRRLTSSVCFYTNTPDRDFLLDWHPGHQPSDQGGVFVASACSGHGFKFASSLGEILAKCLTDMDPGYDLTPFSWRKGLQVR